MTSPAPAGPGLFRQIKERAPGWLEPLLARPPIDRAVAASMPARRILVIRQHDQLGDFLLSVPALRALRARYPEAHIGLVVRSYFADVARMVPFVDEVLVVHESASAWTTASFASFWRRLRSGWDIAVVLSTVSHSLTSDLLALWSRARLVAGSAGRVFPGASGNFLYHLEAAVLPGARHQSERNLDIVRTLGCDTADLTEEIRVPEDELSAARAALASTAGRRIGFHLGAGKLANRWPAERFARLASLLAADGPTRVVLFWGPAESELRDEYERHADGAAEYAGPMPVTRLAAWFGSCDVMVCNDTGVMHLAAAAGVPTVALFGPTDPQEWTPRGDRVRALRGSGGSVAAIGVEEVASCVRALLAAYPPPAR